MFSLVCALPSPASAEGCPPLFGWFTGSTTQSDFSGTYMSAVRFVAFADRPRSSDKGVLEISRFSCMLFLSVRGFPDYAGPTVHSRLAWLPCCLPLTRNEVGILIYGLFAAQSPRPPMPLSTLQETPRDVPSKTRGQDGFATSFPVGLLHPLQHAGLSRRSQVCPSLVKDLGPCAKGRATDTPRLVWHRGVPVSKSRRASRVSLPARRGCAAPHGDYVSTIVPSTSGHRVSKSTSRCSPRSNRAWIRCCASGPVSAA